MLITFIELMKNPFTGAFLAVVIVWFSIALCQTVYENVQRVINWSRRRRGY